MMERIDPLRIAPWMETSTGRMFNTADRIEEFSLYDLVRGVSRICRFGGQYADYVEHYSVAEHLVLLERWARANTDMSSRELKTLLCHDLHEGLLGDVVAPLKRFFPDYRKHEDALHRYVSLRYDLIYPVPESIKLLDERMLATERRAVMNYSPNVWYVDGLEPLDVKFEFWAPSAARAEMAMALDRYGLWDMERVHNG